MAARKQARLVPSGVLTTREKLWAAMRALRRFDVSELARVAGVDRMAYCPRDYISGLVRAGILAVERPAKKPGECAIYALERDLGVEAPRVRRDGTMPVETAQSRMWRVFKVLRICSVRDLVVHASLPGAPVSAGAAADYCQWLARGGYLAPLPRQKGDVARYRFVCDTGAKAPQILAVKQLLDANTGKIMAGQGVQEALDASDAAACRRGEARS